MHNIHSSRDHHLSIKCCEMGLRVFCVEDGCCPFKIVFDEDLYVVFDEDIYVLSMYFVLCFKCVLVSA